MARIVITGASRGIGQATAKKLLALGHQVFCVSRMRPPYCKADSARSSSRWIQADLSRPQTLSAAIAKFQREDVDTLILSAAYYGKGGRHDAVDTSAAEWIEVLNTNCIGHCILVSGLLLAMLSARLPAIIINISSDVVLLPSPGRAAYAASKAGIHAMLRAVEAECDPGKVRVYQLVPTFQTATPGIAARRPAGFDFARYASPDVLATVVAGIIQDRRRTSVESGTYAVRRDGSMTRIDEFHTLD